MRSPLGGWPGPTKSRVRSSASRLQHLLQKLGEGGAPDFPFVYAGSAKPLAADFVALEGVHQIELAVVTRVIGSAAQKEQPELAVDGGRVIKKTGEVLFK